MDEIIELTTLYRHRIDRCHICGNKSYRTICLCETDFDLELDYWHRGFNR